MEDPPLATMKPGNARERPEWRIGYRDFLTLWKDADPNIPIFQQARAVYAKLRSAWRMGSRLICWLGSLILLPFLTSREYPHTNGNTGRAGPCIEVL